MCAASSSSSDSTVVELDVVRGATVQFMRSKPNCRARGDREPQADIGEERAAYSTALLKDLSSVLTDEFGRGFSRSNLERVRLK